MRATDNKDYPARECPSFQTCGAPICPLDPLMEKRWAAPGEEECRALRSTREAIAARYPGVLPTGGLKLSEIARDKRRAKAKARWDALTPEQQAEQRAKLARATATAAAPGMPVFATSRVDLSGVSADESRKTSEDMGSDGKVAETA